MIYAISPLSIIGKAPNQVLFLIFMGVQVSVHSDLREAKLVIVSVKFNDLIKMVFNISG